MNKKNTLFIVLILIVVGLGFYYFNLNKRTDSVVDNIDNSEKMIDQNYSEEVSVSIKDFTFNPQVLKIKPGTKVTWVNEDSAPHTATSYSDLFDSRILAKGESFSFVFTEKGSVDYYCAIHPNMKGTVVVEM